MLYVKNGKITTEKMSFTLPEGFRFAFDPNCYTRCGLRFISEDESMILDIKILENKPQFSLVKFLNHESYLPTSHMCLVYRGGLTGCSLFYRNRTWDIEFYEEQLAIDDGYIAEFRLECNVTPNTRGRAAKMVMTSPIKDFFAKIEAI